MGQRQSRPLAPKGPAPPPAPPGPAPLAQQAPPSPPAIVVSAPSKAPYGPPVASQAVTRPPRTSSLPSAAPRPLPPPPPALPPPPARTLPLSPPLQPVPHSPIVLSDSDDYETAEEEMLTETELASEEEKGDENDSSTSDDSTYRADDSDSDGDGEVYAVEVEAELDELRRTMLDHLPVELLTLILRYATSLDTQHQQHSLSSTATVFAHCRATLRSCCLVSRRMRRIAQPMLPAVFEAVRRVDERTLSALLPSRQKRGELVKVLVVHGHYLDIEMDSGLDNLEAILKACPNVQDLRILEYRRTFRMKWLRGMSNLRRLTLLDTFLELPPKLRLSFPSLVELSLRHVEVDGSDLYHLLTQPTLPNLRRLAFSLVSCPANGTDHTIHNPFAEGLDIFSIELSPSDELDFTPFNRMLSFVRVVSLDHAHLTIPVDSPMLRLYSMHLDSCNIPKLFEGLVSAFTRAFTSHPKPALKLLLLPSTLLHAGRRDKAAQPTFRNLQQLLAKNGIESVMDPPVDTRYESMANHVSRARFLQYVNKRHLLGSRR
ncbi:hypothetical protein JCM8097_003976 [Rhodosporidiobolus ruineniae]